MSTAIPELAIERYAAVGIHEHRRELLAVYGEVYADKLADPFFSLARYWERLEAYAERDGFSLVTGRLGSELVGYALGYTLREGSTWWRGLRVDADPALLVEDRTRTFALTEIMVLEGHRRRGYARTMHDALLAGRSEERATLLVLPDNLPARRAYESWGRRGAGTSSVSCNPSTMRRCMTRWCAT
jgi:ribosomal protein S18 acetylase RimI-like enzyme